MSQQCLLLHIILFMRVGRAGAAFFCSGAFYDCDWFEVRLALWLCRNIFPIWALGEYRSHVLQKA